MAYGFFMFPDQNETYFAPVADEDIGIPVEEGGCAFFVEDEYIVKLREIFADPANNNDWVIVEIAGDEDESIIRSEENGSVFGFIGLPGTLTREEAIERARPHLRFEKCFNRSIMRFEEFRALYKIRTLN